MFQNNLLMAAASISAGGITVDDSVRYNDDDSPRLYRTPTVKGNQIEGSISLWYKRCSLGSIQQLFNAGAGNDITFNASDQLTFADSNGTSYITTQVFRDPSAWGHLLFAWDTGQSTAGNRLRIYHNGVEITAFGTETNPALNIFMGISNTVRQTIGANESDTEEFDGYLSQFYYVDGQQLTPTSFGETDDNGVWRPIEASISGASYGGNVAPLMTSDTAPSGTVSASSVDHVTYSAFKALDGVDDTSGGAGWMSANAAGVPQWWAYEFASSKTLTMYVMTPILHQTTTAPVDWTFDGYNGADWDTLDTQEDIDWSTGSEIKQFTFSNTTAYDKYRVHITEHGSGAYTGINEIKMMESTSGFGTNGFKLDFADSSDFGNDVSGNSNDYTSSGLATNDQVTDTPTKNFSTLNSVQEVWTAAVTTSNGNLHGAGTAGTSTNNITGTIAVSSGKWVFASKPTAIAQLNGDLFVCNDAGRNTRPTSTHIAANCWAFTWQNTTLITTYDQTSTSNRTASPAVAVGDYQLCALDVDNLAIWFGIYDATAGTTVWTDNSTGFTGDPTDGGTTKSGTLVTSGGDNFYMGAAFYTGRSADLDFGQGALLSDITIPTGFKLVNTANLPTPTIPDGTAHFQPTLYTGDGSVRNIDQTGNSTFQPDTVWIKNRSAADGASIFDSNRGATKYWGQSTTAIEVTNANSLTSFDSDGFGLGSGAGGWNDNTENFVAWQWLAGGAGSSNTDGSINTDKTSVNTTAGMSIGLYTGNATVNATVGHGLGVKPDMFIVKNMDSAEQIVMYIGYLGAHYGTYLGATAAPYDLSIYWNDVEPTSTVINLDDFGSVNGSGHELILWAFVSVDGFSKFGSYTGNGDADGTYVYTGFKPAMILIGKTSSTRTLWPMYDSARSPYNEIDDQLAAINSAAETTGSEEVDFLSNGFKIRTADSDVNTSAATYFFAAWAEYPFGGDGVTPATAF